MNTANAIYGLLGSALLVYFVVGLIIFLFVWPYTQVRLTKDWFDTSCLDLVLTLCVTRISPF